MTLDGGVTQVVGLFHVVVNKCGYLLQMTRQRNKGNHDKNIAKELRMMGHTDKNREVGIKAK